MERFTLQKYQLDQIQNGQLAVTIDFNIRDIYKTVPDSYIIYYKTKCETLVKDFP